MARQLSSFIGREHEIAGVYELLPKCSALSLVGAGGCGKTRLAYEVGNAVGADYPDGVFVVELATSTDPALVAQAVAVALGIRERTGQALQESICDYLGRQDRADDLGQL